MERKVGLCRLTTIPRDDNAATASDEGKVIKITHAKKIAATRLNDDINNWLRKATNNVEVLHAGASNHPFIEKKRLQAKKKQKKALTSGDRMNEVRELCKVLNLTIIRFSKAQTIHLRIADRLDYWPSTARFYDKITRTRGKGFAAMKKFILKETNKINDWQQDFEASVESLAMDLELKARLDREP